MLWIGVVFLLAVLILLILLILASKLKNSDEEPVVSLPYRIGSGLLTNAERSFYEVLLRVPLRM